MGNIIFERITSEARFHNPLSDFAEEIHGLEIRRDPLLGDTSVYNPYLKDKAKAFFGENDAGLVTRLIEESRKACFFLRRKCRNTHTAVHRGFPCRGQAESGGGNSFPESLFARHASSRDLSLQDPFSRIVRF